MTDQDRLSRLEGVVAGVQQEVRTLREDMNVLRGDINARLADVNARIDSLDSRMNVLTQIAFGNVAVTILTAVAIIVAVVLTR